MGDKYWTKAQRARKKRALRKQKQAEKKSKSNRQPRAKAKARKKPARPAQAKGRAKAKKPTRVSQAKKRSNAAKKAAATRARLAKDAARVQRAAKKLAKERAAFEDKKRAAKNKKQREKREEERVRRFLEPGKAVTEAYDKTILQRFVPVKEQKKLTEGEVKELRRRAKKILKKKFLSTIRRAVKRGELKKPRGPWNKIVKRDAFKSTGTSILLRVWRVLTEKLVEDLVYRVGKAAQEMHKLDPRRLWFAKIGISSLGSKFYQGAAIRFVKKSKDPIEKLIVLESVPSTGLKDSIEGLLATLRAKLESLLDEGTTTLVRWIEVRHFDFKTSAQMTEWKRLAREGETLKARPMKIMQRSKRK